MTVNGGSRRRRSPLRSTDRVRPWKIGLVNGPNMSNIGRRDPSVYGSFASIEQLVDFVREGARSLGVELCADICSNHEGDLVEWVHGARDRVDGLIVNPAGLTAGGQSMRDALKDCGLPWVEVHCANLVAVDQQSIFTRWASGTCHGMRGYSYIAGLAGLIGVLEDGAPEQADIGGSEKLMRR